MTQCIYYISGLYCLILQKSSCAAQHAHVLIKHMRGAASAKHAGLMVH